MSRLTDVLQKQLDVVREVEPGIDSDLGARIKLNFQWLYIGLILGGMVHKNSKAFQEYPGNLLLPAMAGWYRTHVVSPMRWPASMRVTALPAFGDCTGS